MEVQPGDCRRSEITSSRADKHPNPPPSPLPPRTTTLHLPHHRKPAFSSDDVSSFPVFNPSRFRNELPKAQSKSSPSLPSRSHSINFLPTPRSKKSPNNPQIFKMTDDLRRLTVKLNDLENAHNASKKKIAAFEADARRFTARDEELARKTQDLEKRCDKLEMELKASEWNSVARLSNSRVTDPHQVLSQLHERNTNKPIKGFPKHEQDIRIMSRTRTPSLNIKPPFPFSLPPDSHFSPSRKAQS